MLSSSAPAPAAAAALGTAPTVGAQTSVSLPGGPADPMAPAKALQLSKSQPQPAAGPAAPTGSNVRAGMQTQQAQTQIGLSVGLGGGAREVSASSCSSSSSAGSAASSSPSSSHRSQQPQSAQSQPQFQPQVMAAYPNPRQPQAQHTNSRSPLHTVVTVLTRPSTATPQHRWGLQISLFDGQYLLLGGADPAAVRRCTSFGQACVANLGTGSLGGAGPGQSNTPTTQKSTAKVFAGGLDLSAPHLQPGDLILSINQRPVRLTSTTATTTTTATAGAASTASSFGGSLDLITRYLKTHLSLTIVALRCEEAMMASASASVSGGGGGRAVQQSAAGAYEVMRRRIAEELAGAGAGAGGTGGGAGGGSRPTWSNSGGGATAAAATAMMPSIRSLLPRARVYYRPGVGLVPSNQQYQQQQQQQQQQYMYYQQSSAARYYPQYSRPPPPPPPPPPKPITTEDVLDATYEEGQAMHRYLNPEIEENFGQWLTKRRRTWRRRLFPVYQRMEEFGLEEFGLNNAGDGEDGEGGIADEDESGESGAAATRNDFWTLQGYASFDAWHAARKAGWASNYSWHRAKRRKIEQSLLEDTVVCLPSHGTGCSADEFDRWLDVRKNQWRLSTRKRQRQRAEEETEQSAVMMVVVGKKTATKKRSNSSESHGDSSTGAVSISSSPRHGLKSPNSVLHSVVPRPSRLPLAPPPGRSTSTEIRLIDSIIEEEERKRQILAERDPLDIRFIFDSSLGCPDDAVLNIFTFLPISMHWTFLCVSHTTSMQIRQREYLWKTICPSRWNLPRRPRVPWFKLYLTKIRTEETTARKQSDEVLLKAAPLIFKADKLNQIQKLIKASRKKFEFNVSYTSGVVCERNSLLNLAVINRRHKIAKWLLEECGANIETVDRGNFSPLLNAAWNGDRSMVRYLLIRGANRKLIGKYHSSGGICPVDFQGHNAEGWARERGHTAVADLIRLGL